MSCLHEAETFPPRIFPAKQSRNQQQQLRKSCWTHQTSFQEMLGFLWTCLDFLVALLHSVSQFLFHSPVKASCLRHQPPHAASFHVVGLVGLVGRCTPLPGTTTTHLHTTGTGAPGSSWIWVAGRQ